jgi:signal-transduction protein with cAMP-binding, CBS, and nucleotidyltransferase domain
MENLRKLLFAECRYRMKDETMDMFLDSMSEVKLKAYEALTPYGTLDTNVYVIKSGIIRVAYFNGFREMTYAFGMAGTMLTSYYSFYNHEPSFFKVEACCETVVMKISHARFVELTRQSHDFAQWVVWMSMMQFWFYEKKLAVVNGDVKERVESLIVNRPEVFENVPMKYIASYIGITPQYLCKIKRDFMLRSKK